MLAILADVVLVLIYICLWLEKTCEASSNLCVSFGLSDLVDGDSLTTHDLHVCKARETHPI